MAENKVYSMGFTIKGVASSVQLTFCIPLLFPRQLGMEVHVDEATGQATKANRSRKRRRNDTETPKHNSIDPENVLAATKTPAKKVSGRCYHFLNFILAHISGKEVEK